MKSPVINTTQSRHITKATVMENYFASFRKHIIGHQQIFESPCGKKEIIYADWTASGRAYQPIEEFIQKEILPFVANTHTETTITGTLMSNAYEEAKQVIKQHVNANSEDALIFCGSGMTAAVNKLQRIMGLRVPERIKDYAKKEHVAEVNTGTQTMLNTHDLLKQYLKVDGFLRPVVFVTHMEHHSNQVSWLETIATVEIIPSDEKGNVDLEEFKKLLEKYKYSKNKIAAVTACSNVTGIQTPYQAIAKLIHAHGGLCFVDFACSAPYIGMNMHPKDEDAHLDAIYFSPHKFLGGPGTPGILIFNKKIYSNSIPDQPGGGTVVYSNPWKQHEYIANIEQREDGGTPPFLQGIKAAMCVRLKEKMGVENIRKREEEILQIIFDRFSTIKNIDILEGHVKQRLGVVSFIVKDAHYHLFVQMLNDRFGIQTRGGCSCAGTYGHHLLRVDRSRSFEILNLIRAGNLLSKPGWVRLSIHPTMSNAEIHVIMNAIELTAMHFQQWKREYTYHPSTNHYTVKGWNANARYSVENWFDSSVW